jgi:catechol 2,3-dioxygenase-like lactoylglutathione lyase family enzyme
MAKVTGIGGVFFKSRDPARLRKWYAERLGLDVQSWGGVIFSSNESDAYTVWNPFSADTKYFEPSKKDHMINFRVDDLDALLAQLRSAGERMLDERATKDENGKFGYVLDPEENLLELFEPAK